MLELGNLSVCNLDHEKNKINRNGQLIRKESWGLQLQMIGLRKAMLVMYVDLMIVLACN